GGQARRHQAYDAGRGLEARLEQRVALRALQATDQELRLVWNFYAQSLRRGGAALDLARPPEDAGIVLALDREARALGLERETEDRAGGHVAARPPDEARHERPERHLCGLLGARPARRLDRQGEDVRDPSEDKRGAGAR